MRISGNEVEIGRRGMLQLGAGVALAVGAALWYKHERTHEDPPPVREPRWTFSLTDEEAGGTGQESIVVAGGVVYLATEDSAGLYAIDAATGRKKWHVALSDSRPVEMAVSAGTVYVAGDDGAVHALRTSDGAHRWRARPHGRMRNAGPTAPKVAGSRVLVSILPSSGEDDPDPAPSVLYALDTADGGLVWQREGTLLDVRDGLAYLQLPDRGIGALDPRTGELRWSARPGKDLEERTVDAFGKDLLYGDGGNGDGGPGSELVAYDPRTGAVRWQTPAAYPSSAVVQGGTVYIDAPGRGEDAEGRLHALDAATGKVRWTVAPDSSTRMTMLNDGAVSAADAGAVYLVWDDDERWPDARTIVQAYDARHGRPRWRADRPEAALSALAAPGNHLVVGYLDGWYAYDTRTGRALWRVSAGEEGAMAPVVADGVLYCPNETGVRAVGLARWTAARLTPGRGPSARGATASR
ncbi:PQQ-binding-like beta-propeller repeat protein [Streptomyces sp. NPDC048483]|uniref:outer membrane protein assembly factor BamB family protein n=1 Tax=Streptomyces sp. NPDC048483 TaxID=3154927 RepID=UPI00343B05A1